MMKVVLLALLAMIVSIGAFAPMSSRMVSRSSSLQMGKAITKKEEWVTVLKSKDIASGDLVPVEVDGLAILIAADLDGKIFAIANSCPHLGTPLENGRLGEGSTIVCPLHKSAFSLQSGEVVGDWCPFPPILGPLILGNLAPPEKVGTFPVRAKGGSIEVFIDRNLKERFESKVFFRIYIASTYYITNLFSFFFARNNFILRLVVSILISLVVVDGI